MVKITMKNLIDELIIVNTNNESTKEIEDKVKGAMLRVINSIETDQSTQEKVEYEKGPHDEHFNQMIDSLIKTETRVKTGHEVIRYKTLAKSKEDLIKDIANYINDLPPFLPSGAVMLGIVKVSETAFEVPAEQNQPK